MSKEIQATINVSIWNENLNIDEIYDQIDDLGWCVDFVHITHNDWDESKKTELNTIFN